MGYNWGLRAALNEARSNRENRRTDHCFDAVQVPVHPSDRRNEPEPLRLEKRPELFQVRPSLVATDDADPFRRG
jgi:hypothetical protein